MSIKKVKIQNFKCFKDTFEIELNKGLNILVGNNGTGKSTILEAIHIALTGLYGGRNIRNELSQYLFNKEIIDSYILSVNNGVALPPPFVCIEVFFEDSIDPEFKGNNNSEHSDCEGIKFEISFNEKYREEYNSLISSKNMFSLPIEYYEASWTSFARHSVTIRSIPMKSAMIDSSNYRYQNGSDVYISRIVKDLLSSEEVQDLSGYDLDILKLLFKIESNIILVGDPRQVTYHTHEESRNKTYSNGGIVEFVENECKDCFKDYVFFFH